MKRALIFSGGWSGHSPEQMALRFRDALARQDISCDLADSLSCLDDAESLKVFDVIIPNWTMGTLSGDQLHNLSQSVRSGVGLAGIHGGMGDAFRGETEYEWMVGGHFVAHPFIGDYSVRIVNKHHPITHHLPDAFPYRSEQYYLLTDPANEVLATSEYIHEGVTCTMPVAWTKHWGSGRVFYSALGHRPEEFDLFPESLSIAIQGICWAARSL